MKVYYSGPYNSKLEIFGYETDDPNIIQTTPGTTLPIEDKTTDSFYIKKESDSLKTVLLKITSNNQIDSFYIKYGEQEFYPIETDSSVPANNEGKNEPGIVGAIFFGIGLSLPNIIFIIYRKYKNLPIAPWLNLGMDILLHFAYGNLLGKAFNIGNQTSEYIGIVSLAIYLIIALCYLGIPVFNNNYKKYKNYTIFSHIVHSYQKFEDLMTLDELISYNRKLPPNIYFKTKAQHVKTRDIIGKVQDNGFGGYSNVQVDLHATEWTNQGMVLGDDTIYYQNDPMNSNAKFIKTQESKIVNSFFKIEEYKYSSWQDETKVLQLIKYQSVIDAVFEIKVNFDESAAAAKKKIKDELTAEAKARAPYVICDDVYVCNNIKDQKCYLNEEEKMRIKSMKNSKSLLIGIIVFIFGYTSILDCFTYYEEGYNIFYMEKIISDENKYKAGYMMKDEDLQPFQFQFGVDSQKQQTVASITKEKGHKTLEMLEFEKDFESKFLK